jgi:cyclohexadienyl dehydratase
MVALRIALPALAEPVRIEAAVAAARPRLDSLGVGAADRRALIRALAAQRPAPLPALERIRTSGTLRVGTTGDYAPFSLEHDGVVAGADIALARRLAAAFGVAPVFVATSWPTLLADLAADRFDVALAGISVTAERRAVAAFSLPYQHGGKTPIARCAERERFATLAGIDTPGVRVIVNPGGTNERYARDSLRAASIVVEPDNRRVFAALVAGAADVMITDDVEVELQVRRHPTLCRTMPGTLTGVDKAILMPRDPALVAAVDAWLAPVIAAGLPARLLRDALTPAH